MGIIITPKKTTTIVPSPENRLNGPDTPGFMGGPDPSLWKDVPVTLTRRCVCMGIWGATDTGRSTLALTAPGPIAYFSAQEKTEGLIQDRKRTTEVYEHIFNTVFRGSPDEIAAQATESFAGIERAMLDAWRWARSIIFDTSTDGWVLCQLSEFGTMDRAERDDKANKKGQLAFTGLNLKWESMLKQFRVEADLHNRTNLIWIAKTAPVYEGPKDTGKLKRAGQKNDSYMADVILRTRVEQAPSNRFTATIEKPWYGGHARGMVVDGEDLNFPSIMAMITSTDREEWE